MQIVIEGLNQTINAVRQTLEPIVRKIDNLAVIGQMTAENALWGENSEVEFRVEKRKNGFDLVGEGSQLGFAEFGAGATVDRSDPFAQDVPYRVFSGSYSRDNNGLYWKEGYWYHKGEKFTFVYPRRPMLKASRAMQDEVAKW